MPGCLPSCRMPTVCCSTPMRVQRLSAKVRHCFPTGRAPGVSALLPAVLSQGPLQTWHRLQVLGPWGRKPTVLHRVSDLGESHYLRIMHHGKVSSPTCQEADGGGGSAS